MSRKNVELFIKVDIYIYILFLKNNISDRKE